uniref:Uncharacterized protein n=1 Tax=Anguilla anguilla TaxID=7936 RepID=A0A0E9W4E3_ANGAN
MVARAAPAQFVNRSLLM